MKSAFLAIPYFLMTSLALAAEVPHLEAELTEVTARGDEILNFAYVPKRLGLNRERDTLRPTSFLFTEGKASARRFRILRRSEDRCGTTYYLALESGGKRIPGLLTVMDHAGRICRDKRPARWEVTLQEGRGARYFRGDPRAVGPVPDCGDMLFMCVMVYLPATCTAATLDDGRTPIDPVRAEGSNSCHAVNLIRRELCQRGLDPDRLGDGDVTCTLTGDDPVSGP